MRELETLEYGALPLPTRLGILGALVQLALDGPSVRAALEAKLEEAARVRKAMAEDAKVGLLLLSPCKGALEILKMLRHSGWPLLHMVSSLQNPLCAPCLQSIPAIHSPEAEAVHPQHGWDLQNWRGLLY